MFGTLPASVGVGTLKDKADVMSATLAEIHEYFEEKGLEYDVREPDNLIVTGYVTRNYVDNDGDNMLTMLVKVEESGGMVKVIAPNLYKYADGPHEVAVIKTCNEVNARMKMVKCAYDEADGEVRAEIHLPLEDANLTANQLHRALVCLVQIADGFDKAFRFAMAKGDVVVCQAIKEQLNQARLHELLKDASPDDVALVIQQLEFSLCSSNEQAVH